MDDGLVARARQSAASSEPLDLVVAAVRLVGELADQGDEVALHFVEAARRSGFSWTEIGQRLGVSKQAARKRWGARLEASLPPLGPRLERCLEQAGEEARVDGSSEVTTLHLLLGLQREGVAAGALRAVNVTDDRLRPAIRARLGPAGPAGTEPPPRSPEVICAMEAAAHLARRSFWGPQLQQVGTEHVLFVLGVDRSSPTQLVLDDLGVGIPDVKRALEQCLTTADIPKRRRRRRGHNCDATCSFCGKTEAGGMTVVKGPGVCICNACVELSRDILMQRESR